MWAISNEWADLNQDTNTYNIHTGTIIVYSCNNFINKYLPSTYTWAGSILRQWDSAIYKKLHILFKLACEQKVKLGLPSCEEVINFFHKGSVYYIVSSMSSEIHKWKKTVCFQYDRLYFFPLIIDLLQKHEAWVPLNLSLRGFSDTF